HDAVEGVAVQDQEATAVGSFVDRLVHHHDAAELHIRIVAQGLVVVAGHIDHMCALACLAQYLLHEIVVALSPVPAAAKTPAVDDVADEIKTLGFSMSKEIEEKLGLAAARAEVHIRDPNRPVAVHCGRFRHGACGMPPSRLMFPSLSTGSNSHVH